MHSSRRDVTGRHEMNKSQVLIQKLRKNLKQLSDEVERLQEENEQLRRENKALREEVTVVRLYQEMSEEEEEEMSVEAVSTIPKEAFSLYRKLPSAFKFAEFFQLADEEGFDPSAARDTLLHFLREEMLIQKGARIEKSEHSSRPFSIEEHMQPSQV